MNRVKQLGIVLIAIALVTSAIFYPGAFTSLSADRQSTVDVVGDADAYIGLQPGDGPGGEYATYEDGRLRVALDGSITDGAGVNRGALTRVERVFTISNNGAGPIALWLEHDQEGVTFEHSDEDRPIEDQTNAIALEAGETIPIGITVDTVESELGGDDVLEDVRIVADSDTSGISSDSSSGTGGATEDAAEPWDDWDGEADERESPDEDEFFESTEEAEEDDRTYLEKGWDVVIGVSEAAVDLGKRGVKAAADPIGALEDGVEWASGLKDDLQSALGSAWEAFESGFTSLIEDGSIEGIVDSLVETALATGERAITELSDVGNLKSFLAGFVFGEMGMDGGFLETSLSDSASYLVGSIGGALTPGWGVVADTRDLLQQVANGELIESAITGAGLVLSLGSGGVNPGGALSTTQNWVGQFSDPRKANIANSVITEVVPKLPGEQLPVRIFDQFTDGNTASQLHQAGLSDRQIASLIDSDQLSTVDPNHVERLVDEGVPPNQIVNHLEDGGDLRHFEDSNRIVTDGGTSKTVDSVADTAGLSETEKVRLEANLKKYEESDEALRPREAIENDLKDLANNKNVDNLDAAIRHGTTNAENADDVPTVSNIKGLDQEVQIAKRHAERGEEVNMQNRINEGKTEIDIDVPGESKAIESKATDYSADGYNSEFIKQREINDMERRIEDVTKERDTYVIESQTKTDDLDGTVPKEAVESADIDEGSTVILKNHNSGETVEYTG